MKNLIITLGVLSLMTMGIYYESDCLHMIRKQRQMAWICGEMADCAVQSCENGMTMDEVKRAAEEILRRNTGGAELEQMVWNLEKEGNTIIVKVFAPAPDFMLRFLNNSKQLSVHAERKFYQNLNVNLQ